MVLSIVFRFDVCVGEFEGLNTNIIIESSRTL